MSGFTLIELLLYVAIMGILLTSLVGFLSMVLVSQTKNQTVSEVSEQGIFAMDYITRTVRNATTITTPTPGTTSSSLTMTVPIGASSPTIFSLNGTTLQVKEGAATEVALTGSNINVTNLTFKNLTQSGSSPIIQVSFTLDRSSNSTLQEYSFQKTFTSSAEVGW